MLCSFIIPAYNASNTIVRCLDSIYALLLNVADFEVIIIDDCSKDNTIDVVEEYAKQHTNITVLRQAENHRQGAARNRGVNVAKGKFIVFVDSDDAVTDGLVKAINIASENDTDMTAYHYAHANENGVITSEADKLSFSIGQIFTGVNLQNKHPYWCSGPVAYIYNREFLLNTNYPFREGVLYEDSDFVAVHLYYAERMAYLDELGYLAYYREGSTTHSNNYKNLADYLLLGTRMLQFYNKICSDINQKKEKDLGQIQFADGILEGACFNIMKSIRRLIKLNTIKDVCAFYNRIDGCIDRKRLSANSLIHKYYWSRVTSIGLKHKFIAIAILSLAMPIYRYTRSNR
jgi:glycosyltransferase involved in cell wall biosynthesis